MRALGWLYVLLVAGCAAVPAVPMSAGAEAREILAPGGRLRAGLGPGVQPDLARQLAWQLRVPFEPIAFERDAELLDALRGDRVDVAFTSGPPQRTDLVYSPAEAAGPAVAISPARARAAPFLREFIDDARRRGVVN